MTESIVSALRFMSRGSVGSHATTFAFIHNPVNSVGYSCPMLDNATFVKHVELAEYAQATNGQRLLAFLFDLGLFLMTLGVGFIIWSLIVYARGLTPAKQILRLRVVETSGDAPVEWSQMFIREAVLKWGIGAAFFLLSIIPGSLVAIPVTIFATDHDLTSNTGQTLIGAIALGVAFTGCSLWYIHNGISLLIRNETWWTINNSKVIKEFY